MGFFSSRKAEPTPLPTSEESSVNVIRSRFYGKNKLNSGRSSPVLTALSPSSPPSSLPVRREVSTLNQSPSSAGRQVSADALTMSLAQRLNDLAMANADGLLDDEEYRLLRHNLFERFAAGSESPTEVPVVPISAGAAPRDSYHHVSRPPSVDSQRSIATAMSSLFRRATGRPTVVTSPAPSVSASASGSIFSLQQQMSPDTTSNYSRPSFSSGTPRSTSYSRSISRRPSDDSLMSTSHAGSTSGSVTNDLRGIMTRHRVGGGSVHYASSIASRVTTRSGKPPSSFHLRQHPSSHLISPRTHEDDDDEDHPKSVAELRAELENVEDEGRKLLDAFNGLELTALTKSRSVGPVTALPDSNQGSRRLSIYTESASPSTIGSAYTLIPDRAVSLRKNGQIHTVPLVSQPVNLKRKPSIVNSIAGSFKSSTSDLRSGFLSSTPPSLHSSRSSPNLMVTSPVPPVPALPISISSPNASSIKKRPSIMRQQKHPMFPTTGLSRVSHTAPPVPVPRTSPLPQRTNGLATDRTLQALEAELADIRRRKTDVCTRYERRLDFLRAKLKAAEIRERLGRK